MEYSVSRRSRTRGIVSDGSMPIKHDIINLTGMFRYMLVGDFILAATTEFL